MQQPQAVRDDSGTSGSSWVRFAVDRRVTMGMAVLGVIVLGWISLTRLPLEYLPSFSSHDISIEAPYPSSSPEEIERLLVQPLEDVMGTLNGVEKLSARASASSASIDITFVDGTDMDMASVEVRDRLERVRHLLPDDLEQVRIRRFQSTDIPVIRFDLSAPWSKSQLYEFAENVVQRRLERLEGVAQVSVRGLRTPELQVNLDPDRLRAHGLDVRQVVSILRDNNANLSAGTILDGSRKLLVRAVGEFQTPREVAELPLNAAGLRVSDVARVVYDFPRQEEFNYLNGLESLTVSVNKASGSNLLEVSDLIKAELKAIEALESAAGLRTRVYRDSSDDVRKGLGQLRDAGVIGGLLAVLAVFLFVRRFRTTLLVGIAMPISVVTSFVLMYFMRETGLSDITLNVVSLAGLMLALGMLVDNSIVVIESIFRHRNDLGEDSRTAAITGTAEVAMPIVASTATTICVFLPLVFLASGGRFKLYFQNIATTICLVIVASLLVALTVVPMVAAIVLRDQAARRSRFIDWLTGFYGACLTFTLRHRLIFVMAIMAVFGWSIYLFTHIERTFGAQAMEREVSIHVDTPLQYSLEQTSEVFDELYALLDARRDELDIADIAYSFNRSGGRSRGGYDRSRQFSVFLKDESESKLSIVDARDRIRELLPVRAGVTMRIATSRGRSGSTGVEVQLSGDDPKVLELLSSEVAATLGELTMIRDVDVSLESGDEEIHVGVERERLLQAGLSTQAVAQTISSALSSRAVSHFKTGDREVDLVMQYAEEDRETLDQLKNVAIYSDSVPLPLGALAEFEFVAGPRSIEREDHRSQVTISANTVDPSASFSALNAVSEIMSTMPLPPGYEWSFGRTNRYQREDQDNSLFALLFALPLIYMLLAALFESYAQPLTIMLSVPFAMIGVGIVMNLTNQQWDTMTMIGMIVLVGVVVNNAIVLINHINFLRQGGLTRDRAIVEGGQHRLRPILITAVTTILGMMPLVAPILFPAWFGPLEGRAATWAPIGLVIVGGLTTSTFLTLMIIPTIYSLIDDLTVFARRAVRSS